MHLVGVGGSGMSGLAEVLVGLGHVVSGSDLRPSRVTERLRRLGVRCSAGHDPDYVDGADVVVVSAAVPPDNPERRAALRAGIPVVGRGAMLARLAASRRAVAVAGSHGKTTTTAMVAVVLEAAGLDPTAIVGGTVSAFGGNARLGHGELMVVEADESDRSFLRLSPEVAVMTNLDEEHLDTYGGIERLERAFADFAARVPPGGCVVACLDDERLRRLLPGLRGPVVTYGLDDPSASLFAVETAHNDIDQRLLDRPFLHLALAGEADALVTGDAGIPALAGAFAVPIFTPRSFRRQLSGEEETDD